LSNQTFFYVSKADDQRSTFGSVIGLQLLFSYGIV